MTTQHPAQGTRLEHDLLGYREVDANAYYGIHTLRALENFAITGNPISDYPQLAIALADIKQAAALANGHLGMLDSVRRDAIVEACEAIRAGELREQFVVDLIQGGAGTSTNMNANEVICNKALEILSRHKGDYAFLHPNEHVNMSQSTNDVYPTALRIATYRSVQGLLRQMEELETSFSRKAHGFRDILKVGRTQLQDAVPMTLGQEMATYAVMLGEDRLRLVEALSLISEINLGATAIGTGINAHPDYAALVREYLCEVSGLKLHTAPHLIEATQDCGAFVQLSGVLKRIAVKLSKVCNDLRLLSSGPRAGLGEINLPPVQAGSSIMPGKVNPVIPEVVNQVAFEVIGNDMTITMAAEGGQLQLNAFEPVIAYSLFRSIVHLTNACRTLDEKCVRGITPNIARMREMLDRSVVLVTALNPYIGYEKSTEVAREALESGRTVSELVLEKKLLSAGALAEILRPEVLTAPRSMVSLSTS
ncbi:aspartate ammonia-lyase [Cupriavidus plantarum]|uniref:aspartate ammonia-lyase n=1 Tax=Cupriavidus plantarum TaxID=942865 RepID=UPI0015CEEEF4|nr:aspartate ammonia-lyase [Cupriavidus plantarum]NYI02756.1 aspartate ammonia-lyase [Cupriavidus plantarum]